MDALPNYQGLRRSTQILASLPLFLYSDDIANLNQHAENSTVPLFYDEAIKRP